MGKSPCSNRLLTRLFAAIATISMVTVAAFASTPAQAALEQPTSANSGTACASGVEAADLNAYFAHSNAGLWGADYQRAFPLPDGRVLWMFQDVFLAVGGGTKLVHNAGLIQSGRCFTLLKGPSNSEWLLWDRTHRFHNWYWPMGGEVNPSTGHFDLMMAEMREGGSYLSQTTPVAMWRVSIRLSDMRVMGYTHAPDSSPELYGWSVASDTTHTYLFGHCYRQFGFDIIFGGGRAHDKSCTDEVKLARVNKGRLDQQPTYWDGYKWVNNPNAAVSVIPANHAERDINPAQIMFDGKQWVSITKAGDWFGRTVFLDYAPSPMGPWVTYHTFQPATKCNDCNTYFASWVPWKASNGNLIGMLGHNRWDGRQSSVYRPTVFEVPAPPPPTTRSDIGGALVSGSAPAATSPSTPAAFTALEPCRLFDTRDGGGASTPARWTGEIDVSGECGIPDDATSVSVTVTAVRPSQDGWVTLFPSGTSRPTASHLNYQAGEIRANGAVVKIGSNGKLNVWTRSRLHLTVDVTGAWTPTSAAKAGRFETVDQTRVLDTRSNGGSQVKAGTSIRVPLPAGVPSDATAVAVNITGTKTAKAGYYTAYPSGTSRPLASTLNMDAASQTRNAMAIVPVNAGGFDLYTTAGGHIIVDVSGWFTGNSAARSGDGLFVADDPTRLVDTREQTPGIAPGFSRLIPVGVEASAVVLNIAAVSPIRPGYYTAYPSGDDRPNVSSVNIGSEGAVANLSLVGVSGQMIEVFSYPGGQVAIDRAGWFT